MPVLDRIAARLTVNAVIIALITLALVAQTVRIEGFRVWPIHFHGLKERLSDANGHLAKLNEAGKQQKRTSERTVEQVVKGDPQTKEIVRVIREAPNPEGCRTPSLELLRDVL